ncbi:MAG: FAD-binding oxidoreductase [Candidatus Omnitrophota bacterium]
MIVKTDPSFIKSYLEDSSNLPNGHADKVVLPESIEEVCSCLREANAKKTPVTISGAGTGQAGGRVPLGGILLSMERLDVIRAIKRSVSGGYAVVEAGVSIRDLKRECEKENLFYTYDPTEQGAFVGGTIATNASGARSFRYGSTRRHVIGLKIVLAGGDVLELERGNNMAQGRALGVNAGNKRFNVKLPSYTMPDTKNSAGYYAKENMDIVDLFVGQEGTLGVIVEARIGLFEKPGGFFASFIFFRSEIEAQEFATCASSAGPLSIEYFDKGCLELLRKKSGNVPARSVSAIFIEDEILESEDAILSKWEGLLSKHAISLEDTWVAMSEKAHMDFLEKRRFIPEHMSEMARASGFPKVSTDLSVPKDRLHEMINFYKDHLDGEGIEYFIFGHIGDAHLHVNMLSSDDNSYDKSKRVQLEFVKKAISLGGTVSAEHGIGKTKKEFLKVQYGARGVEEMIAVKKVLDPNLIMGRGNVFDC